MIRPMTRKLLMAGLAAGMALGNHAPLARGQETSATTATQAATWTTASGRAVFWRGEPVGLALEMPLAAPTPATVTLAPATDAGAAGRVHRATLRPDADGLARLHLLLPTELLGDGVYTATVQAGEQQMPLTFTVRETVADSPGMVINDDTGPNAVAPQAEQAQQTGAVTFMQDRFTGSQGPERAAENRRFDELADQRILLWSQDATRPMSFNPPHSAPETDGEYRRRLVLANTFLMRYPAFAGYLFDYDPCGYGIEDYNYNHLASYWGWGKLAPQLKIYLDHQQQALIDQFRAATGFEPFAADDAMRLAVGVRSPESMGYMDQPTRRWATEIAARSPAMDAAELEALKQRGFAWFDWIMELNARRYRAYLEPLRGLDPTLKHSTSNTINHSTPRAGNYHPAAYEPLDFRFVAVWDDQGGIREHIYETVLAATLLGGNRRPDQPLWIDTVFSLAFPGNHFRNGLQLAGRAAHGTGYSFEIGSSLTYGNLGRNLLERNDPYNQEIALNARLMRQFGALIARATHSPRVGLLYSKRQIAMTPYAQSYCDGMFKMIYLLAHVGLPPALITEEMLAGQAPLPASLDAIVVLAQHEQLAPEAMHGLAAFAAAGGRLVADTQTTVAWPFVERSAALDLPFRDLGHPWNMATAYNRGDDTVGDMRRLAAERTPQLRALLQDAIYHVPLDSSDPDVAVVSLAGGAAHYAAVINDSMLDLEKLFSDQARMAGAYTRFHLAAQHGRGVTSSWMPLPATLRLSPRLPESAAVYDLLERRRLDLPRRGGARTVDGDLTAVSGRLFAILPAPVGAGELAATQTLRAGEPLALRYKAGDADGNPLAAVLPVELTLRDGTGEAVTTLYRATDANGWLEAELPTGIFLAAGNFRIEARQLLDGAGVALPVTLRSGEMPPAQAAATVAVRDPGAVRRFLAAQPELVVPVFDDTVRPAAERLVTGLRRQGVPARMMETPETIAYVLGYAPTDEEQAVNATVERGEAIGRVRFENQRDHINANFYGSAFTGYRFGRHVLLLGTPGTNPVLDAVKGAGLPWSDRFTAAPGGALVQWLPMALCRDHDTLIVAATDAAGLEAGVDALLEPPAADPVTDGVRAARHRMMQSRALPLGQTPGIAARLTSNRAERLAADSATERFSMAAVTRVEPAGERLLVSLARYGHGAALVDPKTGAVRLLPAAGLGAARVSKDGELIVTTLHGLVSAWSSEGELLWNAIADFKAFAPEGGAVLESDKQLYRIATDGASSSYAGELPTATPLPPRYRAEAVTEKDQHGNATLTGARVVDTTTDTAVAGFRLTTERPVPHQRQWRVLERLAETADGEACAVYRLFTGENSVQLYRHSAGDMLELSLPTDYLCAVAFSADGKRLALAGREGRVRVFAVADGRELGTFGAGAYPRLFALPDGGFAAGSSDGLLTLVDANGAVRQVVDLDAASRTQAEHPEQVYARYRAATLHDWFEPPTAQGELPLTAFHLHLRDEHGELRRVIWPAGKTVDFRWSDAVQGAVTFPQAGVRQVTITAAAKYFDDLPMNQPGWNPILNVRDQVVTNERPAPHFRILANGRPIGTVTPDDGKLVPFKTERITVGWAKLDPKPEEFTTFRGRIEVPAAGPVQLAIEAHGMTDCVMTGLRLE